jgi:methylisocitrate lyase
MTWLTDARGDERPAGDRLARLWAEPGIVRIPGVHDPLAALLARRAGFSALYLSGAALTASLALPDLGILAMPELVFFTRAIVRATGLPLIVDGDTGYGEALNVVRLVRELEDAGAAAVQLEDQMLPKKCGHLSDKRLVAPEEMARKVAAAGRAARHLRIVARTDAVESEGLAAAAARARLYRDAGAHVIFPEALRSAEEFRAFAAEVPGPLLANMTEFGRSPLLGADELDALGYKLVIWPVSGLRVAAHAMEAFYEDLAETGTQTGWLERMQTRKAFYATIGYHAYEALDDQIARSALPAEPDPPASSIAVPAEGDTLDETRPVVRQAGGVVVALKRDGPRFLVIRARKNPSHWIFPKGHVEPGESAEAAAVREVAEEAGVVAIPLAPLETIEYEDDGRTVRVDHFMLRLADSVEPREPRDVRWCSFEEASELLTFESSRDLLRSALVRIPAFLDAG